MTDLIGTAEPAELAEIRAWWETGGNRDSPSLFSDPFQIAGSPHDQVVPDRVRNPYWEIIRHFPSIEDPWDGVAPSYVSGLSIGRMELAARYSWSIPSPGDMAWLVATLAGRPLVEVGAGSGYWAWQAAQAGIHVVAYEPAEVADNHHVDGPEYFPLLRDDAGAVERHPDRALLLCWPTYSAPWAAEALATYKGDVLIYIGEGAGGCCADDAFFEIRDAEWEEIGRSPYHVTWWGIHCRMEAYRRRA